MSEENLSGDMRILRTEEKLAPCPFCGSEEIELYVWAMTDCWNVRCEGCGATTLKREGKDTAIKSWNRRAESTGNAGEDEK